VGASIIVNAGIVVIVVSPDNLNAKGFRSEELSDSCGQTNNVS